MGDHGCTQAKNGNAPALGFYSSCRICVFLSLTSSSTPELRKRKGSLVLIGQPSLDHLSYSFKIVKGEIKAGNAASVWVTNLFPSHTLVERSRAPEKWQSPATHPKLTWNQLEGQWPLFRAGWQLWAQCGRGHCQPSLQCRWWCSPGLAYHLPGT